MIEGWQGWAEGGIPAMTPSSALGEPKPQKIRVLCHW